MNKKYEPTNLEVAKEMGKTTATFGKSFLEGYLSGYMIPTTVRRFCDSQNSDKIPTDYFTKTLGGTLGAMTNFVVNIAALTIAASGYPEASAYPALEVATNGIDGIYEFARYQKNLLIEKHTSKKKRVTKKNLESVVKGEPAD